MRQMLLGLLIGGVTVVALPGEPSVQPVEISNDTQVVAKRIYVGDEQSMPLDGRFVMAIRPMLRGKRNQGAAKSVGSAYKQMYLSLPTWYLQALKSSSGDQECAVYLNNVWLTGEVSARFLTDLGLKNDTSLIRRELRSYGLRSGTEDIEMFGAFFDGFCEFVKSGSASAALQRVRDIAESARKN
jgi:hypothetical protein